MINIKILIQQEMNVFDADPIYSVAVCEDTIDSIIEDLSQYSKYSSNDICGFLSEGYYFIRQGQPINKYFIETVLKKYELIIPYEEELTESVICKYFVNVDAYREQREKFLKEISAKYPELLNGIKFAFDANLYIRPNLVIGAIERLKNLYQYADGLPQFKHNDLLMGLLIKAWIVANNIRVRCVEIKNDNPDIWKMGYRKIEVIQNYIDVVLKDYIAYRKSVGFSDCFADNNPYQGDFGGKYPIWMCWWQGENDMPELIKACISSVKRNAPTNAEVILVTLENVGEYVSFTDQIIEKFNNGIISYTHLSDILRSELIYRYGGIWIDATYYIPHRLDEQIFEDDFFSIAFEQPLWGMDIMRGRWTLSVLAAKAKNLAVQYLMEGLWFYWDNADELADYFLIDYVFDSGYRAFPQIKECIDSIRKSSNAVYDLQLKMNQRMREEDIDWLKHAAGFYKLNRRNEYIAKISESDMTFYGYILNGADTLVAYQRKDSCTRCNSYIELVEKLRAYNPRSVLDYSLSLCDGGIVSRGILNDFLYAELQISAKCSDDINNIAANCIYDSFIKVPTEITEKIEKIRDNLETGTYLIELSNYSDYDVVIIKK